MIYSLRRIPKSYDEIMKQKYLILILLFFLSNTVFGQYEQLVPLGSNPVIKQYLHSLPASSTFKMLSTDTIDLPVVDDFSTTEVFPDPTIWTDNDVFVNSHFARNMITVGVATFDGLDQEGNPYNNSSPTVQGGCDTLTSKFIRLLTRPQSQGGGQFTLADSLTLSFYYQKKGWGDAPDSPDSLVVDFFNGTAWSRQWFTKGAISNGQDTSFTRVQIRITNSAFLVDGFRFRFRTYGSRTGSLDHWHLDYVKFFKAFNQFSGQMDTAIVDVAMTQPATSLMKEYSSVPWDHFISLNANDQQNLLRDSASMYYRVTDIAPADVGFNNRIFDFQNNYVAGFGQANGNIFPARPNNVFLKYTFSVDSVFPNSPSFAPDTNYFTVKNYFTNGNAFGGLKSNDTVTYIQKFENYYSLDDGTAEVGYDLINAPNGKVAMKFEILKTDTLRAVRIHFVQQGADVSTKFFTIKIWSSLSPETVIYQEASQRPVYIDEVNGFATYVLDQLVPVSGTIYIGFQQILGDGLHLGFDRNTASNSRMFYNIGNGWIPTLIADGTFMMRGVMGDSVLFTGLPLSGAPSSFEMYPNPANSQVFFTNGTESWARRIEVFNIKGELIKTDVYAPVLDISLLPSGIYFVCLRNERGEVAQRKLIISK